MSVIPITTYCECKVKDGHYDGDSDMMICNRCNLRIEGSHKFTMAELAQYNERYKKYLKVTKDMAEIEAMFSGDYESPSVSEINAKVERQREQWDENTKYINVNIEK